MAQEPPAPRGRDAEQRAYEYLIAQGLMPVARNYRAPGGEIDLIMRQRDVLVFVEVRFRRHARFGSAAESVNHVKQARLRLAAEHYLQRNASRRAYACRFDVVALDGETGLQWLQNAFEIGT